MQADPAENESQETGINVLLGEDGGENRAGPIAGERCRRQNGRRALMPYILAVVSVVAAAVLTGLIWPANKNVMVAIYYLAVTASATYGNRPAAILAIVLSILSANYFVLPPYYAFSATWEATYGLIIFSVVSGFIVLLVERLKVKESKLRENEAALREKGQALRESEERLRFTVESSRLGHWDLDLTTNTARRSLRHDQCFGYTEPVAEWDFEKFIAHVHPEDRAWVQRDFLAATSGLRSWDFECRVVWPDGSTHWISALGNIYHRDGKRTRMLGIVADITARKAAEDALRESEHRYRHLIEGLPAAVYLCDAEGRITLYNAVAAALWGRKPELGKDRWCGSWRIYHPDGAPLAHVDCPMAIALREGRSVRGIEIVVERPDGTRSYLLPHPDPIRDASGAIVGGVNVLVDLTERKQAEAGKNRLAQVSAAISDYIAVIGSDFHYRFVNEVYLKARGLRSDEMVGQHMLEIVGRERFEELGRPQVEAGLRGEEVEAFEWTDFGSGVPCFLHVKVTPFRESDGTVSGVVMSGRDITAHKRAEELLRESQARLELATRATQIGPWDWDLRTNDVNFSQEWKRQIGYEDHEIAGRYEEWESRLHPVDRDRVLTYLHAYFAGERPDYEVEFRLRHKDGSYRWIFTRAEVLLDAAGKPYRMFGCHLDITERKQADAALRQSEERYRDLVENSREFICTHDLDGLILSANRAAIEVLGYDAKDYVGKKSFRDVLAPEVSHGFDGYLARIRRKGVASGVMLVQTSTGERRLWEYYNTLRTEGVATPIVRGMARDITARKEAEEKLWKSLNLLRAINEGTTDAIFAKDLEGRYLMINTVGARFIGKTPQEVIGRYDTQIFPSALSGVIERDHAVMKMGAACTDEDVTVTPSGLRQVHLTTRSPLRDSVGAIVGLVGISRDITERKRAEEALLASEGRYRDIFTLAPVGIYRSRPDGTFITVNKTLAEMLAYDSVDELLRVNMARDVYLSEDEREKLIREYEPLCYATDLEIQWKRKDGSTIWIQLTALATKGANGATEYFDGFVRDVTAQKQAEEKLWQSLNLLRAITEGTTDAIFAKDLEGHYLMINTAGARVVGKRPEEVINRHDDQIFSGATLARILERDRSVINTDATRTDEDITTTAAGLTRVLLTTKSPLRDSAGEIIGLVGVARDITERKKTEEAMAAQALRSKTLMEMSMDSIYVLDNEGDLQEANAMFLRGLGYSAADVKGLNVADWDARWTREELRERLHKLADSSAVFETRHRRKDGSIFDAEVGVTGVQIDGESLFFCVARDITERKRAEKALSESEQRFRQLAENIDEVFWISDREAWSTIYVSPGYERIWGRSCEHLYASPKSWMESIHPEDKERMVQIMTDRALAGPHDNTYRIVRPDGSVRWIRDRAFPVRDENGAVVRFAGIASDITESKEAADALHRVNRQLSVLSRHRIAVQEEERRHLARELHDQIGQALTAAKISVQSAQRSKKQKTVTTHLDSTVTILDQVLEQVRRISFSLRSSVLDDLGLAPALRSVLHDFGGRAGWTVEFHADAGLERPEAEVETACYRIALEALTNVLRHAEAKKVVMELRKTKDGFELSIRDDGVGFEAVETEKQEQRDRLGLVGMRERASAVGGDFKCASAPGKGTEIRVAFSFAQEPDL